MAEFIQQNWGTILVGAGVLAVIVLIIVGAVREKHTCGGNCSSCGCCKHAHNSDKPSLRHSHTK